MTRRKLSSCLLDRHGVFVAKAVAATISILCKLWGNSGWLSFCMNFWDDLYIDVPRMLVLNAIIKVN